MTAVITVSAVKLSEICAEHLVWQSHGVLTLLIPTHNENCGFSSSSAQLHNLLLSPRIICPCEMRRAGEEEDNGQAQWPEIRAQDQSWDWVPMVDIQGVWYRDGGWRSWEKSCKGMKVRIWRNLTVQMVHKDMIPDESPWDRGTLMKYKFGIIMAALCFTV